MLVASTDHDEDDGDKNDNGAASDWSKKLIGWLLSFRSPAKNAGDGEEGAGGARSRRLRRQSRSCNRVVPFAFGRPKIPLALGTHADTRLLLDTMLVTWDLLIAIVSVSRCVVSSNSLILN